MPDFIYLERGCVFCLKPKSFHSTCPLARSSMDVNQQDATDQFVDEFTRTRANIREFKVSMSQAATSIQGRDNKISELDSVIIVLQSYVCILLYNEYCKGSALGVSNCHFQGFHDSQAWRNQGHFWERLRINHGTSWTLLPHKHLWK